MSASLYALTTAPPVHGFLPEFFTPRALDAQAHASVPGTVSEPRVSYLADRDGSYADFCNGDQFALYRNQMGEALDFIIDRCRQLEMPKEIEQRFRLLFRHRFEEAYFDTHAELIDSAGKRSLDNFCAMLKDPRLTPQQQRTAILNLSEGVTVCASGAVANLIAADRDLALSVGGVRGKLWQVKEDTAREVLRQAIFKRYGADENYAGNEIHYINAAWNHIADAVGLNRIPDWTRIPMDPLFLESCKDEVLDALAPAKLALKIAGDCLSEFRSRAVFDPESPSVPCDEAQTEWLNIVLGEILRDLGLTESELNLHAFVRVDDELQHYHVRDDPSLIALALLKAMDAEHLLAHTPDLVADIVDQDGERAALYSYGSGLAWRLRQSMTPPGAASWQAHEHVDVIDDAALRAWPTAPDAVAPPAAAVRRALRDADPAGVMAVRANWLGSGQALLALLGQLQPAQAIQYLDDNMPYLQTWHPFHDTASFAEEVMHRGPPGRALVRAWYPDPWVFMGERDATSEGGHTTRLQRWIETDDAAAIDALGEIIGEGWFARENPVSLRATFYLAFSGEPDTSRSVVRTLLANGGSVDATAALQRLLRRLVSLPGIGTQIASRLPYIFCGHSDHLPAMLAYMFQIKASAGTIAAVHRMLFDPLILPHIAQALPTILLGARAPERQYPMWQALQSGKADCVRAYGALLSDAVQVPGIRAHLRTLLRSNRSDSRDFSLHELMNPGMDPLAQTYGLVAAAEAGSVDVVKAYRAILTHPAVNPCIRGLLGELMLGDSRREWWPRDRTQMLNRIFGRWSAGYSACRDMMADPLILPEVLKALPNADFLTRIGVRKPGFLYAAASGNEPGGPLRNLFRRILRRLSM